MNKIYLILINLLLSADVLALSYSTEDLKLDANGYVGYKYITASEQTTVLPSAPEIGLALSGQYGNHLSAYTQFAYDGHHNHNEDSALVYSFLAYDIHIEDDLAITFKGGKLRHQYGLYNSYRVNPRTRPGVIVPQAIYWDALSHLLTSGVGVGFDAEWKDFEFGYEIDDPATGDPKQEAVVWSGGILNEVHTSFGSHQSAYIKYDFAEVPLTLKSSWMRVNIGKDISKPAGQLLPYLRGVDQVLNIFVNSVQYSATDKLTLTAEAISVKTPVNRDNNIFNWPYGYSFTAKYDVTDKVAVYSNYNYYKSPRVAGTPIKPWYAIMATDASVGVNYHENKWQIGAEAHYLQGGRWVNPQDFKSNPEGFKEWWLIGINFTYFF